VLRSDRGLAANRYGTCDICGTCGAAGGGGRAWALTYGGCPGRQKIQLQEELEKLRKGGDLEWSVCHEKVGLPAGCFRLQCLCAFCRLRLFVCVWVLRSIAVRFYRARVLSAVYSCLPQFANASPLFHSKTVCVATVECRTHAPAQLTPSAGVADAQVARRPCVQRPRDTQARVDIPSKRKRREHFLQRSLSTSLLDL
jgi:hypothetical protein